jgi:hypothetical protein
MSRRTTRWSFLFGATLVLAACGGSGGTSPAASDDGGGGGTTATSAPGATTAPEATTAPTADSGSGGGGGVGDFSGNVCDLVTLDQMNAVTATAATKAEEQPFTQGSGFCTYTNADGSAVGAISLVGGAMADANLVFSSYKSDPSAEAFPVNGGEAIWFANNAVAIVLKNGYTGSVQILSPKDGDMKTASTALLQGLADNMP